MEIRVLGKCPDCAGEKVKVDWLIKGFLGLFTFISVLFGCLFGYFEKRIYPEVKVAQKDVKDLRHEVYKYMLKDAGFSIQDKPESIKRTVLR